MLTISQITDSFHKLLERTLTRQGFDCSTKKGRIEAGRKYGLSHQTIANYLDGRYLPPSTRIPLIAAAMGVSAKKLRQVVERERHPEDRAGGSDGSTVAQGDRT